MTFQAPSAIPDGHIAAAAIAQQPTAPARHAAMRALGKADRRTLTDAIKAFADYVDPTGTASTRPDLAYSNMTRAIYRPAGLNALQKQAKQAGDKARDVMSEADLEFLRVAERTTADVLRLGMADALTRHAIKANVRDHVQRIAEIMKPTLELAARYQAHVEETMR